MQNDIPTKSGSNPIPFKAMLKLGAMYVTLTEAKMLHSKANAKRLTPSISNTLSLSNVVGVSTTLTEVWTPLASFSSIYCFFSRLFLLI